MNRLGRRALRARGGETTTPVRLGAVRLDVQHPGQDAAAAPAARWVQVAYSGAFKGHASGEFEFTDQTFAKLIQNFRAHPSYQAGAPAADAATLSTGTFDVVPWDFHHASEQAPTTGTIPTDGAPAQGWALELETRLGPEGETQLWAFTRFLEPLKSYVREGKYKWASVTVYFNAVDPVSGQGVGPYMSSIAATNDPFLQGMVPLTAKRETARGVGRLPAAKSDADGVIRAEYYFDPYKTPETAEELLCELRELFELSPTSELGEVLGELAKLRAWATGGTAAPIGVDVPCLVGCIRKLFNLPTLATAEEVFAAADGLLSALAEQAAQASAGGNQGSAAPAASASRETDMEGMLKILAARFNIPVDEETVKKAVVARLDKGESAMTGLSAILTALGVEDVNGATQKIAQMFQSVDQLEKAMPELASLREGQTADEEKTENEDVDQTMATYRLPEAAKPALLALRTGGVKATRDAAGKVVDAAKFLETRRAAKASFFAAYPKVDAKAALLTQPAFGSGSGAPPVRALATASLGAAQSHIGGVPVISAQPLGGGPVLDLENIPGNATEKALRWLETNEPSSKQLTRPELFARAGKVLAQARQMGQRV